MKIIWKCVSPFLRFASPPRGPAAGLLALTVLVFAFAAQAEQVTFVSNTGQGAVADGYYTHTQYRAQQFTTGDHTAGYELSEIVVDIGKSCVIAPAFSLYKSSADAQNLEVPGAKVIDLIGSASSQGRASFTPARATTLTRSTKYFVLFKAGAHAGTLDCKLRRTLSSNVDDGAASGWDIAGRAVFSPDSGSTWTNTGGGPEDPPPVIRIAIKGAFKSSRNTRVPQRVSAPAPENVLVEGSAVGLDVSWTEPGETPCPGICPAITHYDLQYRRGASGEWIDGPQGVTDTSTAISVPDMVSSYQVRVRAVNADDQEGAWSDPGEWSPQRVSAPAPENVLVEGSAVGLDVSWTEPGETPCPGLCPAVAHYDLQYRRGASGEWIDGPQGVTDTSTAISVPDMVSSYQVRVRAVNVDDQEGAWSEPGEWSPPKKDDSRPLKVWLSRFVRAIGDQVLDAVEGRVSASQAPEMALRLGGQDLALGDSSEREVLESRLREDFLHNRDERLKRGEDVPHPEDRETTMPEFLLASSFHLASAGDAATGARWSLWGRGARSSFDGVEEALTLDGDVTTATLGLDFERNRWLLGIALSRSTGDGSFKIGGDCQTGCAGEVESAITGFYPYARYRVSEKFYLWGALGHGQGDLTFSPDGVGEIETDIEMGMAAAGARGVVLPAANAGDFELALRADLLVTSSGSDAAESLVTELVETEAETSRIRLLLEGSRAFRFGEDAVLTPSVELGIRYDGGDAETGGGLEVGGSVRYASGSLTMELSVRGLLAHSESDYEEWGMSGSVRLDPGADGRGLSVRLGSARGASSGGVEQLWAQRTGGFRAGNFDPDARMDAEVAYGLDTMRGLLTPYTGVAVSEGGESWRAGARFRLGPSLDLELEASLTESRSDEKPESGVLLRGSKRW